MWLQKELQFSQGKNLLKGKLSETEPSIVASMWKRKQFGRRMIQEERKQKRVSVRDQTKKRRGVISLRASRLTSEAATRPSKKGVLIIGKQKTLRGRMG